MGHPSSVAGMKSQFDGIDLEKSNRWGCAPAFSAHVRLGALGTRPIPP
jgi:hypothetical protein